MTAKPSAKLNKLLTHGVEFHDAGMTEKADARAEQQFIAAQKREARKARIAEETIGRRELIDDSKFGSQVRDIQELPADFVADALGQIHQQLKIGNFEAIAALSRSLAVQWELLQAVDSPIAAKPYWQRLATYLSECRDSDGKREIGRAHV